MPVGAIPNPYRVKARKRDDLSRGSARSAALDVTPCGDYIRRRAGAGDTEAEANCARHLVHAAHSEEKGRTRGKGKVTRSKWKAWTLTPRKIPTHNAQRSIKIKQAHHDTKCESARERECKKRKDTTSKQA